MIDSKTLAERVRLLMLQGYTRAEAVAIATGKTQTQQLGRKGGETVRGGR